MIAAQVIGLFGLAFLALSLILGGGSIVVGLVHEGASSALGEWSYTCFGAAILCLAAAAVLALVIVGLRS